MSADNEVIFYTEAKAKGIVSNLIRVHISKCRCSEYFWDWDSNSGDWRRGEKISEDLKRFYNAPYSKSSYM